MRPFEIGVVLPIVQTLCREAGFAQVDLMLGPGTVEAFDAMAPVVELVRAG